MTSPTEPNNNPYEAPRATVTHPFSGTGAMIEGGRTRPAGAGLTWIGQGWRQFSSAPLPWLGATILFLVIAVLVSLIPVVSILGSILNIVLLGGIYLGCRAADEGGRFTTSFLFAGFSGFFGRLAGVGALLLASYLGFAFLGGLILAIGVGFAALPTLFSSLGNWEALRGAIGFVIVVALLGVAYLMVVSMLGLFAPILAVIYDQSAVESLKGSFTGCLRNLMSITVFSLALLGLGIACLLTAGLGFLVLLPVFFAATYYAARDIFEA